MNKYYYTLCLTQRVDEYEGDLLLWNSNGIIVCSPDQLAQEAEKKWLHALGYVSRWSEIPKERILKSVEEFNFGDDEYVLDFEIINLDYEIGCDPEHPFTGTATEKYRVSVLRSGGVWLDTKQEKTKTEKSEKTDLTKIDLNTIVGKSEKAVRKLGFKENKEDGKYYYDDICVGLNDDGQVNYILIKGDADKTPSFRKAEIGMNIDTAMNVLQGSWDQEENADESYTVISYNAKEKIVFEKADDKITSICYSVLSDEEIEELKAKAEEEKAAAEQAENAPAETAENNTIQFIGRTGVYIAMNPWGDLTGRLEIISVESSSVQFKLGLMNYEYESIYMLENAQITSSNRAQYSAGGFTIYFEWTDADNVYVTQSGQLNGTDAGVFMDITDNQTYAWSEQYSTPGGTGW